MRQRPDMTIAVDWDVKHQFKQTNKQKLRITKILYSILLINYINISICMTKSARIIRMTNWANTRKLGQYEKTGPIQKNKANMKMTSFDILFQKKMAAMFSSVSPLKNCSCIYNISLNCSCIYRSRNYCQQLSLIKRKNGIQTTSFYLDLVNLI